MKPKRSKRQKLSWWGLALLCFIYLPLLPALFAYYPGAVTAWLDAWHILFGNLPNIAAFLYEAEYMVNKHGLSMPHTYYIHGFWVYFGCFVLCVYAEYEQLKTDNKTMEEKVSRYGPIAFSFVIVGIFCFLIFFLSVVFVSVPVWGMDLLFEYSESGGLAKWLDTWWGFQFKPLLFVCIGSLFSAFLPFRVFTFIHYYSIDSRFLQLLKHKGD